MILRHSSLTTVEPPQVQASKMKANQVSLVKEVAIILLGPKLAKTIKKTIMNPEELSLRFQSVRNSSMAMINKSNASKVQWMRH